jgi:hypothetical protein
MLSGGYACPECGKVYQPQAGDNLLSYEVEVTEQVGEYSGPHYVVTCPTCKRRMEWTENGLDHNYQRMCGCGLLWRVEIRAIGERP